jgi:hypothetical protein
MKSITVRLHEVLRRRGAHLPTPLSPADAQEALLAAQRCAACPSQSLCEEELRSGRVERLRLFCPNAHYIECLRRTSLTFG